MKLINNSEKIFVAGHNGLVGSAIVRKLKQKGFKKIIIANRKDLDLINQQKVISFLKKKKHTIKLHDPYVKSNNLEIVNLKKIKVRSFDALVLAVPHMYYLKQINFIKNLLKPNGIFFDIKGKVDLKRCKTLNYWSL